MAKSSLSASFERVGGGARSYRDIAAITGEVGAGKTHFCLTAPDPIVVFNIDRGLEGVAEKEEFEDKEIYQHLIDWSPGGLDESELEIRAVALRDEFIAKFKEALKLARTILIDTESRLWQIYRYSFFGSPNSGNIKDYDALNQKFEDFVNLAKGAAGVNLFLIRSMKNKWGQTGAVSNTTGKRSMAVSGREVWGYEHLPGIVMTEMFFRHDPDVEVDADNTDPNYRYVIDIGKCRHNLALQHTTVPRCSFPRLGQLMIPGSKTKDWK